jgi:hypothetical protein
MPHKVLLTLLFGFIAVIPRQDTSCPAYPLSVRTADEAARLADQRYAAFNLEPNAVAVVPPVKNVIDKWIFEKMSADGVDAAPLTNDSEFVRRIYLDLTGRIPTYEEGQTFFNTPNRDQLINDLLASPAYTDQWAHWFLERFQVRAGLNFISVPAGINFYSFIRDFVAKDRPYNSVVRELLTSQGDGDVSPGLPLLVRQISDYFNNPRQDAWDDITDMAATQFLGLRTECISCHDGAHHLEKINLFLTQRKRRELWQLSAFFSRMRVQGVSDDNASYRPRLIVSDATTGLYNSAINPSQPGARPARTGANEEPVYWLTGRQPEGDAWRSEFARFVTEDRQFARASVNYIWAHLFGSGIVDPADGWDFNRTDPSVELPDGWDSQNSHPELLEALTDYFISHNYSVKSIVRLIVTSNTYQLSSRYPAGKWQDVFSRYFARHEASRLTAEQLIDSLATATGTSPLMTVPGLTGVLRATNQLPYPYASTDYSTEYILNSLGRGDYLTRPSISKPSLFGVLDFMNNWAVAIRTRATSDRYAPQSRLSQWMAEGLDDNTLVRRMFLSTLTREPTSDEMKLATDRKSVDRNTWFSGVQWALVQKSDFAFNY